MCGRTYSKYKSIFFFQAEDGIRYSSVTGVQTCALPISRADSPNRFVGNQNTGELLRGQRAGAAVELAAENLFGKTGVALFLCFADASDWREAAGQGYQGFLGDIVIGLAKKLAALGVADDDESAAGFGKHGCGNFAGEGAFFAPRYGLAGDGDAGTLGGFDGCADRGERWGDHYVAMLCIRNEREEGGEKRASVR